MERSTKSPLDTHPGTPRSGPAVLRNRALGGLAALLVGLLVWASPSLAKERGGHARQIRVIGSAATSGAPDRVFLDVAVVTRAESAARAAEQNAGETRKVMEALRAAFPDTATVSTSGYALVPEYEYDKQQGRRTQAGYAATNSIHVELEDVTKAGALIDAAVAAGSNDVRGVRFGVAESSELERQALVAALADARTKAQALADSVGLRLGRTLRIEEGGAVQAPMAFRQMARADAESTMIEPGDVFFEASVSLWVEIVEK